MIVDAPMRKTRALKHLKQELEGQELELARMEMIKLNEIRVLRTKKEAYISEIKIMIRTIEEELAGMEAAG